MGRTARSFFAMGFAWAVLFLLALLAGAVESTEVFVIVATWSFACVPIAWAAVVLPLVRGLPADSGFWRLPSLLPSAVAAGAACAVAMPYPIAALRGYAWDPTVEVQEIFALYGACYGLVAALLFRLFTSGPRAGARAPRGGNWAE